MNRSMPALLVAGVLLASSARAETSSLLVLSKRDHTLAIVDPASLAVVAKMPVGDDPHEVIASADGSTAYVSNYGSGSLHSIAVLDLKAHQALAPIELGPLKGPHGLAFNGGKLWFTVEGAKAIGRFDPATQKVDFVLGTGQDRTHMIDVSPDGQLLITTNVSSGTVSVMTMQEQQRPSPPPGAHQGPPFGAPPGGGFGPAKLDWHENVIKVGGGSEGFDVTPDRKEIWVANSQDGTISIIDTASQAVVATLAANVRSANRLKITPDGNHALVSMLGGPDLAIIDVTTRKEVKRLPIGRGAAGIVITPDGLRAFVACTPDDTVAVIDLRSMTVVGHIKAGRGPDGMAWSVRH